MAENNVDEFLAQVNGEESNLDLKTEANPFAEMNIEQKEEKEEEVAEEKPLPFNQDPKIKRYIEKEVAKLTANMTKSEVQQFKEETGQDDLVSAFTAIIGNDTPEKRNALDMLGKTVDGLKEKAESATRMIEAERQADREAEEELAKGFEDIEDTFNVDFTQNKKLRSDFIDFVQRVAPKDSDGEIKDYPDFQETFRLFQEMNKKPLNNRAKDLASRSMTRSSETSASQMPTDTSWKGVEKYFNTLKG